MRKKKVPEQVDIRFRNSEQEILDFENFDQVCLEIAELIRSLNTKVKKIGDRHGVRLSSEMYFTLNSK